MTENRKRKWLLAAGLLLLAWAAWAWYQDEARARRVRRLRQELVGQERRQLSAEEQQDKVQQLVQEYQALPFKDRRQFAANNEKLKAERERLRRFAEASPAERRAILDEDIKRQEQLRALLDKRRRDLQAAAARDARAAGDKGRDEKSSGEQKGRAKHSPQALDRLEAFRKELLDMTTPQERAHRALYLQKLTDWRKERGLKPLAAGGHF